MKQVAILKGGMVDQGEVAAKFAELLNQGWDTHGPMQVAANGGTMFYVQVFIRDMPEKKAEDTRVIDL